MIDLLTALGLMLVIEGAMYALFPEGMKELIHRMGQMPARHLRLAGIVSALFGFTIVGFLRGF